MARGLRCVVVLAGLLAVACAGPARTPPPTAPAVDLARYAGTWYEIARLPAFFQRDCVASWAQYTLRPSGIVDVTNGCRTRDGRERRVDGEARVVEAGRNARLLVRFDTWFAFLMPAPRDGNYRILDVTPDYDAAIAGTLDRGYLWLLARTPHPAPEHYAAMVERARSLGFAVDRLVRDDWSGGRAPAR